MSDQEAPHALDQNWAEPELNSQVFLPPILALGP